MRSPNLAIQGAPRRRHHLAEGPGDSVAAETGDLSAHRVEAGRARPPTGRPAIVSAGRRGWPVPRDPARAAPARLAEATPSYAAPPTRSLEAARRYGQRPRGVGTAPARRRPHPRRGRPARPRRRRPAGKPGAHSLAAPAVDQPRRHRGYRQRLRADARVTRNVSPRRRTSGQAGRQSGVAPGQARRSPYSAVRSPQHPHCHSARPIMGRVRGTKAGVERHRQRHQARCAGVTSDELVREAPTLDPPGRAPSPLTGARQPRRALRREVEAALARCTRREATPNRRRRPTDPADEVPRRARARRG